MRYSVIAYMVMACMAMAYVVMAGGLHASRRAASAIPSMRSDHTARRVSKRLSKRKSKRMSERMSEHMSKHMPCAVRDVLVRWPIPMLQAGCGIDVCIADGMSNWQV